MTVLDYHQKVLCPDVWSQTEQSLSPRASVQIDEQVGDRFPDATAVYLIGDMTGHYWTDTSDLDLLVRVDREDLPEYRQEAQVASGYALTNTDHKVNFYLVPDDTEPAVIAANFGPLFDLSTGTWIGHRNLTTNELARSNAIIQYVNWNLFKVKKSLEVDPHNWKVLLEAFRELPGDQRDHVVTTLSGRVKRLEHAVEKHLKGQPKENWKLVEQLEEELDGNARDIGAEYSNLPRSLLNAVLHTYRYDDLVETLKDVHETMTRNERTASAERYVAVEEEDLDVEIVVDEEEPIEVEDELEETNFWKRIDMLVTRICQARGGFANSSQTIYDIFAYVLEGNKFVKTKQRQRDISMALYKKFYKRSTK